MYLNKLLVVGYITENTPKCVLRDILVSSQYDCENEELTNEDLIQQIYSLNFKVATPPEDYPDIASFINYKCTNWKPSGLLRAYSHLMNYNPSYFSETHEKFGPKTQDEPFNLDVCLIYKICKYYNLNLHKNIECQEMINLIKKMSMRPTYDNLSLSYRNFDKKEFHQNLGHLTDCQLVLYTALSSGVDIISSTKYREEYESLSRIKSDEINSWSPVDPNFRNKFNYNPYFFIIYSFWNPIYNFIYMDNDLACFAQDEGMEMVENSTRQDYEHFLQISRLTPTFYPGKIIGADKKTPIYMEETENLKNKDTVSYGIYDDPAGVKIYTFSELAGWFSNVKKFANPQSPLERFTDISMRKLNSIIKKSKSEQAIQLKDVIKTINDHYKHCTEEERKFVETYSNTEMKQLLQKCLELGMYMRGWKVNYLSYPLSADKCLIPDDKYETVEKNVQDHLQEFMTLLELDCELKKGFELIPLYMHDEFGKHSRNTDPEKGLTLLNRLEIVANGDSHNSVHSCIRTSSNWIIGTSHKYLSLLGAQPEFKLSELRFIS